MYPIFKSFAQVPPSSCKSSARPTKFMWGPPGTIHREEEHSRACHMVHVGLSVSKRDGL